MPVLVIRLSIKQLVQQKSGLTEQGQLHGINRSNKSISNNGRHLFKAKPQPLLFKELPCNSKTLTCARHSSMKARLVKATIAHFKNGVHDLVVPIREASLYSL